MQSLSEKRASAYLFNVPGFDFVLYSGIQMEQTIFGEDGRLWLFVRSGRCFLGKASFVEIGRQEKILSVLFGGDRCFLSILSTLWQGSKRKNVVGGWKVEMKYCFDCDDTLYDQEWPFLMAMQEVVPDAPIMDMDQFYKDYTAIGESIYDMMARGIITVEDHGILRAYRAFVAYEIPFSLEQAADFQEAYVHYLQKISLSQIYRDYFAHTNAELAVFSNGDDTRQRMKFANLQLFDYFDENKVFTSDQIGYSKPDKKAYEEICRRMHTNPTEWFYIGDNYINDMEGAKQLGFRTIHLNRHKGKEGPASDYVVYSESGLIDLLEHLDAGEAAKKHKISRQVKKAML